jgi:ubiquinone/menaquinone biosynthesis C-methylase UbiE
VAREAYLEPILRWLRLRRVIADIPSGAQVLDVGCGRSATFLKAISPKINQGIGIDMKVQPMRLGNLQTVQQRLTDQLPFEESQFDVVTMLAVLEHLDDEQPILQEIYRVLKPNGRLILTVPSVWAKPVLEFLSYRLKLVDEAEIRDHKRYYHRSRLRQVLIHEARFRSFNHRYFQLGMNNFCTVIK